MKYHTLFLSKTRKDVANVSSAVVVIGALRVKYYISIRMSDQACISTQSNQSTHEDTLDSTLYIYIFKSPGRVAQSVTRLATDACLTADSGVASSIPARSHTFVEIDHEIISTVILLPSADSFKKGCCQLQAKVCAQTTG